MDTVREHFGFLILRHTSYLFGYGSVGKQHKFFYQLIGVFWLLEVNADRFPFLIDLELHFVTVEVDSSCWETFFAKCFGDSIQCEYFFLEVSFFCLDNLLCLFVSKAAVGVDNRMNDAWILDFTFFGNIEDYGESQLFFIRAEGTDEVTQSFGKHRNGAVHQIDGSGAFFCLFVNDSSFFHVMRHIGDVYTYFPQSFFQFADRKCIVEVFGIFRVNSESGNFAEVLTFGNLFGWNFGGNLVCRCLYRLRIDIRQTEFGKNGVHLRSVFTGFAKYINDLSDRIFCLVRPFGHFHNCFVSGFTTFQLFFRDKDVIGKCAVFRHQKSIRLGYFQCTDKCIVGTFQYFYYFPFGILVFTFGVEGDLYFVVVHRMGRVAFGHKDRIAPSFGDEGILSVTFPLEGAGHLCSMIVETELSLFYFADIVIIQHFVKNIDA